MQLEHNRTYQVSRDVPLMPEVDPVDPMEALAKIRIIKAEGRFVVTGGKRSRQGACVWWYRVATTTPGGVAHVGWINSTALIGGVEEVTDGQE